MNLLRVYDNEGKRVYPMHPKRAISLATKYPSRFTLLDIPYSNQQTQQELYKMPTLPAETKRLNNGAHILHALEVKTTNGQFGQQEEILCIEENTGENTRVWIPHNSRPKITQAALAGLVSIDEQNGEWTVNVGARFQVFVAGGKIVGVAPAPAGQPAPAQVIPA